MEEVREVERYLAHAGEGLGHAERQAGLRGNCTGLMAPLKRKSVEPMAADLAPSATRSRHEPLPPSAYSGRGNVPTRQRLGEAKNQRPMPAKELAFELDPCQWQSLEWREGHKEPMKYWLSTLAVDTSLQRRVLEAKMRRRIERDYQDLKQALGLGHHEGRGWRGCNHHASLSIAAALLKTLPRCPCCLRANARLRF